MPLLPCTRMTFTAAQDAHRYLNQVITQGAPQAEAAKAKDAA
jgi:hypothetical protein